MDARTDCRQWLDRVLTDRQHVRVRYAVAYANWRLPSPSLALDDARDELGDEAVQLLEKNIEANEGDIESYALPAASGESRSPRVARHDAGPMRGGRSRRMFGGGLDRAEAWFRSAVGFFEAQSVDLRWPDWDCADACAWLGRTLAGRGDTAGAREQYSKALDIEADFA